MTVLSYGGNASTGSAVKFVVQNETRDGWAIDYVAHAAYYKVLPDDVTIRGQVRLADDLIVDVDEEGQIVGVEVLHDHPSHLDLLRVLQLVQLPSWRGDRPDDA